MFDKIFKIEDNWAVFFDLFSINGNGDSIRPLAEELRRRRPEMKFFFCDKKHHRLSHIDMADEIITEKTLRFKYVCSKAKYIISPMGFPNGGKKRKGQVFVQTWHGNALKKTYLARDKYNKKYIKYAKQFEGTDLYLLQGEITRPCIQECFNLKDEMFLNSGYPRNDILFLRCME
jgi:CDP-glycerol glycerophosphotransferase